MPLNDRSRLDFSRCFSISYNSYFPRLLLPNWVQDYYSACENYRLRPGSPYGIRCHAVLSSVTGVSRIVDTFRSGKKRRNRSRFAQAGRNQSSLRDASDGAAENITFQRESAKSLTSGTSVPKKLFCLVAPVYVGPTLLRRGDLRDFSSCPERDSSENWNLFRVTRPSNHPENLG